MRTLVTPRRTIESDTGVAETTGELAGVPIDEGCGLGRDVEAFVETAVCLADLGLAVLQRQQLPPHGPEHSARCSRTLWRPLPSHGYRMVISGCRRSRWDGGCAERHRDRLVPPVDSARFWAAPLDGYRVAPDQVDLARLRSIRIIDVEDDPTVVIEPMGGTAPSALPAPCQR